MVGNKIRFDWLTLLTRVTARLNGVDSCCVFTRSLVQN